MHAIATAIANCITSTPKGGMMTKEQFKSWLLRFDSNRDGKISREELRQAIKDSGGWFPSWKSYCAIKSADSNGNGCIDEDEINNLVKFAYQQFGITIVTC